MDKQVLKLGARILENLPEMDGSTIQDWIDNPGGLQVALQRTFSRFRVWKTIRIGTGPQNVNYFREALKRNGNRISGWADDLLNKFTPNDSNLEVDLVNVLVANLGLKNSATLRDIYKRARELGLQLCPAEIGPQLRLQYQNQPNDEWLRIGMEPIADSDGYSRIFLVGHGGDDLGLDTLSFNPKCVWSHDGRWVFVVPRK